EIVQPLADYGGGSGCGAMFLAEPGFPEGYSPALYTADWGRNWVYRHRMTPNGATFKPDQHEFIGSTRVTDLDVDASSRLYVTSWKGATFTYAGEDVGYLLQFKPKGYTAPALPDYAKLSVEQLVRELKSSSHRRRLTAQRELLARPKDPTSPFLRILAHDGNQPMESRVAAFSALALSSSEESFGKELTTHFNDPALHPFVLRAWGDLGEQGPSIDPQFVNASFLSSDPRIRLEFAVAAGKWQQREVTNRALYILLRDADAVVRHTATRALITQKAGMSCLEMMLQTPADAQRDATAALVVQSAHEPRVVEKLIKQLDLERNPSRLKLFLTALCRLHQREGTWKGNSWGTRPDTTGPYFQPETWEESPRIAAALQKRLEAASPEEAAFLLTQLNRHKISLDGTLDRLLTMAAKDAALVPAAVTELSRAKSVPANAVGLLKQVATDQKRPQDQRLAAVLAWMRARDDASFSELLRVLPTLDDKGKRRDLNTLWAAFLTTDRLGPHATLLVEQSQSDDQELALWATAGLWALTSPKGKPSPEVRAIADKAMEAGTLVPAKRRLMIESLRLSNQREFADSIQRAVGDDDLAVAELARDVAKQWKLELSPTPRGPKVSTLKPEEVLAALQKLPGKAGTGEALFAKLNCAKCHTVKEGEPLRGPFLPNVAKTYKRDQLAESILLPSKSLAQGFVTYVFTMDSGKTFTGFVTNEAADTITIRDNEGKEFTLPVQEIEERAKSSVSVMPEGLVKDLTVEEFASLIAYLESLAPSK
ncbi:MAG: c-type cytochrome, partial [Planctomycetaceae bacterium]|nr:c-type cytochrome [Planctomycetaceae bacterium]